MNGFKKLNNLTGWAVFLFSLTIYWLTMEPTVSFWDCGEFIAAADKLQIGHQPGAPLFLMIGKMFSLLAAGEPDKVAYWINFSSALFSAATVMFLYWTIVLLVARVYKSESFVAIAAGVTGALALTFSDTFWFSAAEAEVYSLSILFTAIVFWSALMWERKNDDRWLVLIAFIVGLSIGVHLLSLLVIPAVVLIGYFKKTARATPFGLLKAIGLSALLWVLVQYVVIQYTVLVAAKFDMFFVNQLNFGFGSGVLFFLLLLSAGLVAAIMYSVRHKKYVLNLGLTCLAFLYFGFSAYALIIIRANAKPDLNLSDPDNAYGLYNYLGRTNYGSTPLLFGPTFDAQPVDVKETGVEYRRGKDKYEVAGEKLDYVYGENMFFPRVYSSKPHHIQFYQQWMNLAEGETPSFMKNLKFFFTYQLDFMYWRYFFWNFAGRQNDVQGYAGKMEGNWLSGIKWLDKMRLEKQQNLPPSITQNEGYNRFYALPLVLGVVGLIFMFKRSRRDALVVMAFFFMTGPAIILYLNQDPMQVRERDYAYVGSFYAFAILIGFAIPAIKAMLQRVSRPAVALVVASFTGLLAGPVIMGFEGWDDHNRSGKTTALEWAKNYLNSCAPNAILITNADNDTFPLWYVQQVEGFRTDVRVVNYQYLSSDDYIDQLKRPMGKSAPLPVSMDESKYVQGRRDFMRYVDYGIQDSVELGELLSVLTSDNNEDKLPMNDGSYENFLPTRKLKITVDAAQVIQTGTVAEKEKDKIAPKMEWEFNRNAVSKADLVIFDLLATNNWKRPVYFASTVGEETYVGLDKYLYLEGFAHRLLPLKRSAGDDRSKTEVTNSDVMYHNVMNRFDQRGYKTARYLDPESRRIAKGSWLIVNTLSANLLTENKSHMARNLMLKSVKELPLKIYSIDDTLVRLQTAEHLYLTQHTKAADQLVKQTADFLNAELAYFGSLGSDRFLYYERDIRAGLFVLNKLQLLTAAFGKTELSNYVKDRFEKQKATFI
ncbi:glycosyltransferase family 117 protein [Pedobacter faecalis]|uniref:glycosyltransferase family 117 protein n=1 Tax=Pedobacter faecalis TaxID=3041495 RepID=UPI00254B5D4D|nr:DUF2723 domain-containing protein [Pedobacter sp. ELA7]